MLDHQLHTENRSPRNNAEHVEMRRNWKRSNFFYANDILCLGGDTTFYESQSYRVSKTVHH